MTPEERLYRDVRARAESYSVRVGEERLGPETPGKFDGLSVTINPDYDFRERPFYLVHALGSIVRWSLDPVGCRRLFDELNAAKKHRSDRDRLERAIEPYREFEVGSSEYAVWLLADLGYADVIPAYTNFWRADLESMTHLHRTGKAPVWREFYARWNEEVRRGERQVAPFEPRPVPPFRPQPMKTQEVVQEQDGEP